MDQDRDPDSEFPEIDAMIDQVRRTAAGLYVAVVVTCVVVVLVLVVIFK